MQASQIPPRFVEPFAKNALASYTRTIPQTTSDPNAASLDVGFPPNTFVPQASGGVPPDGRDFNGLLNQVTAWAQWFAVGGPVFWDSAFSIAIGGYPKGGIVQALTQDRFWVSLVDNNPTNPDTGGTGWVGVPFVLSNAYSVPIDGVVALPSSSASPLTIAANGIAFLKTGTLASAALYPLARVTTHYSPSLLNSAFGDGSELYKVGINYVRANQRVAGTSVQTASALSGSWATQAGVSGFGVMHNGALVLIDTAATNKTTDGAAFTPGTIPSSQWTDADSDGTAIVAIRGGDGAGTAGSTTNATSTDGISWTPRTLPAYLYASAIASDGAGTFLYVTGSGGTQSAATAVGYLSTDHGVSWAPIGALSGVPAVDMNYRISLEYQGGRWFLSSTSVSSRVYSAASASGAWSLTTLALGTGTTITRKQSFAYDGQHYIQAWTLALATDGINFAYPGVAGEYTANTGLSSRIVYMDSNFRLLARNTSNVNSLFSLNYSAAGYVGLPYVLPTATVPSANLGPTDALSMFVRVN